MLIIHEIKLLRYQSLRFILFCSDKNFRNWPSNCAYKLRKFKQKGHTNEFLIKYMFSCILINIPFNLHTNLFSFLLECYFLHEIRVLFSCISPNNFHEKYMWCPIARSWNHLTLKSTLYKTHQHIASSPWGNIEFLSGWGTAPRWGRGFPGLRESG